VARAGTAVTAATAAPRRRPRPRAGGGSPDETTTPSESGDGGGGDAETRLSWHAGGQGGTYYPLSNEFKTVVEDNTDFTLNVQSTGASVENVGSLANGDADFALIQNDIASFAKNGTGIEAFEGNAIENLMGVATLYPETITVVTLAETGIEQLTGLEGATINTGDLGSGTQVNALQILEAVGVEEFDEQNASPRRRPTGFRNGDIDAAFVVGGWPVGAIEDLANTNDINIVPIEGENRQAVMDAADWFAEDEIPGGTLLRRRRGHPDRRGPGDDRDQRRTARRDGRGRHRGHLRQHRRAVDQDRLHHRRLRTGRDVDRTPRGSGRVLRRLNSVGWSGHGRPLGAFVVLVSVVAAGALCRDWWRVRGGRRGRRLGRPDARRRGCGDRRAVPDDPRRERDDGRAGVHHSVEKSRVYDEYTVRGDRLEMTRMEFESYGWGYPPTRTSPWRTGRSSTIQMVASRN